MINIRMYDYTGQEVSNRTVEMDTAKKHINDILYKSTHVNHPCSIWARHSSNNYKYLYELFCNLCDEYTYRYNRIHLTDSKLRNILMCYYLRII